MWLWAEFETSLLKEPTARKVLRRSAWLLPKTSSGVSKKYPRCDQSSSELQMLWKRCIPLTKHAMLAVLGMAAAAAQDGAVLPGAEKQSPLSDYFADRVDLGPIPELIDSIMAPLAAEHGSEWAGINLPRTPVGTELTVLIVDSERVSGSGCGSSFLRECRVAVAAEGNCAAMDERTIVCDVRFLLSLLSLSVHAADEAKLRGVSGEEQRRRARFDEFFADDWSPNLSSQMARAKALAQRRDAAPSSYRTNIDYYLIAAISVALAHEYGHVILRHVRSPQSGLFEPRTEPVGNGATLGVDDEADADGFAIEWIGRKQPSWILGLTPLVLADLQEYSFRAAAVSAGFDKGALSNLVPTEERKAAFAAALLKAGLCDPSHPSSSSRIIAMTRSHAFAPARAQWPDGYFDRVAEAAGKVALVCQTLHSVQVAVSSGEAATSVRVVLLDQGEAPRTKLRYAWIAGADEQMEVISHFRADRSVDDVAMSPSEGYDATVVAIRVMKTEGPYSMVGVQPKASTITSLQSPVLVVTPFDDRGGARGEGSVATKESSSDSWKEDESVADYFRQFAELRAGVILLPDEEIGRGGSWSIRSTQDGGISETIWTLMRRNGNRLTLTGTITLTPGSSHEGVNGRGTAEATVDLAQPSPHYQSTLQKTTTYVAGGRTFREVQSSEFKRSPRDDLDDTESEPTMPPLSDRR
jgi:hypothetical protein